MAGGTVTVAGGNVIHTFTSSGYLTPIVLVTKSLRFRASASAYLDRTFPVAGNRKTYTLSLWVKRGILDGSTNQFFFGSGVSTTAGGFYFLPTNELEINPRVNNTNTYITTTQVFRDPSAWYHIVVALDTTQATDSNRLKLYVNGVQVTAFSTTIYPALNGDSTLNNNIAHWIGRYAEPGFPSPFDGYLAEYNFIDGLALTPNSFGYYSDLGVWQPIRYGGSYGTNGFYLPFTNTTSTTTLGYDFSPNGNNWTTNNISLTSGSTYDSMTDVPTLTSATVANYCTLNAALQAGGYTLNDGNLNWARTGGTGGTNDRSQFGTIGVISGKWYWEFTAGTVNSNSIPGFGIAIGSASTQSWGGSQTGVYIYESDGLKYLSGTGSSYGATFATGDIIGVAFDADAGTLTFYKNNVSQGQAASGLTSGPYFPAVTRTVGGGGSNGTEIANFGQRPFVYTPPANHLALNTFNLPTPTIGATASSQANDYFDVSLWTGNGTSQSITNSGSMQPDFVWYKGRSTTFNHGLFDSIRGTLQRLSSNLTSAESTTAGSLTAFNSNGFSVGSDAGANQNTDTYVGWQWRASNATAVTNTAGSITSTVSANTTAGFSIVTYTGTGANATVGHGLGVAPSMVIVKTRSLSTENWNCWHTSLGGNTYRILLNTTAATDTGSPTVWSSGGINPTSTTFTVGTANAANGSAATYVAYCFAQIAGYSAFGSYTGNGSSDGTFIFTGFRPRFVMIKRTDTGGTDWILLDSSRDPTNVVDQYLAANLSDAETVYANDKVDFLSNGFKQRGTASGQNGSGGTYIYMAFAESPFKYANAR